MLPASAGRRQLTRRERLVSVRVLLLLLGLALPPEHPLQLLQRLEPFPARPCRWRSGSGQGRHEVGGLGDGGSPASPPPPIPGVMGRGVRGSDVTTRPAQRGRNATVYRRHRHPQRSAQARPRSTGLALALQKALSSKTDIVVTPIANNAVTTWYNSGRLSPRICWSDCDCTVSAVRSADAFRYSPPGRHPSVTVTAQ